jgi:hypothetical protein
VAQELKFFATKASHTMAMAKNTGSAIKNSVANTCIYFNGFQSYIINLISVILSKPERKRNQKNITPGNQIKRRIVMHQITLV